MKLIPALDFESQRQGSKYNEIYVHKDGKFYHIYDWSAWLVKSYVCTEEFQKERGDATYLQAIRYKAKNREYVVIGFPVESLSKYIPDYEDVKKLDGDDIVISINFTEDMDFEEMKPIFEEWKASCPMHDKKQKGRNEVVNGDGKTSMLARSGLFQIASKVLSYPLESTTPTQNIQFISQLRQEVAALL